MQTTLNDRNIIVAVLAVPATAAQTVTDDLVAAGIKIIFQLLGSASYHVTPRLRTDDEPHRPAPARALRRARVSRRTPGDASGAFSTSRASVSRILCFGTVREGAAFST
jgi:hypothetical protein